MDIGVAVISGLLGAGGIISFVQFMISRHDNQKNELDSIRKDLKSIKNTLDETITRVTRVELKGLIDDDPDNIEAIMQVAGYYFVDLDGNAYMHTIFEKWAEEHGQSTNWLPTLRNERSNNGKHN